MRQCLAASVVVVAACGNPSGTSTAAEVRPRATPDACAWSSSPSHSSRVLPPVVLAQARHAPKPPPDPAAADSNRAALRQDIQQHAKQIADLQLLRKITSSTDDLESCYSDLARRDPTAEGTLTLSFVLSRQAGKAVVSDLEIAHSEFSDEAFHRCILTVSTAFITAKLQRRARDTGPVEVRYPLTFTAPERPDLFDILSRYPEGTAALFYSHGDGQLRVWLLDSTGIRAQGTSEIDLNALGELRGNIAGSLGVQSVRTTHDASRGLRRTREKTTRADAESALARASRILFPADVAGELPAVRHLVIVPTADLGSIPWYLLEPAGMTGPLVETTSISVAPSLGDLADGPLSWTPPSSALVVGDPSAPSGLDLPSLPGARREATLVAQRFGTTPLSGDDASEHRVRAKAGAVELLYLATHGVVDPDSPLDGSFLMLSEGGEQDGRWTAAEIQRSQLSGAKLAVLSACQTGLGSAHAAGVIGIARGFQIAGVPRIVMSLWDVDDPGTYELMCRFVRGLDRHAPAEALRRAALEQRDRGSAPRVWAAFAVFGLPG